VSWSATVNAWSNSDIINPTDGGMKAGGVLEGVRTKCRVRRAQIVHMSRRQLVRPSVEPPGQPKGSGRTGSIIDSHRSVRLTDWLSWRTSGGASNAYLSIRPSGDSRDVVSPSQLIEYEILAALQPRRNAWVISRQSRADQRLSDRVLRAFARRRLLLMTTFGAMRVT